jgi:hypothetical protein
MRWTEHFKRFEGLTELDRHTVVSLIQSIRIMSKTELQITFNYRLEYEQAREAAALCAAGGDNGDTAAGEQIAKAQREVA